MGLACLCNSVLLRSGRESLAGPSVGAIYLAPVRALIMPVLIRAHEFAARSERADPNDSPDWRAAREALCTSLIGSDHIQTIDLEQRVSLTIIARARRGWRNLKFCQCVDDDFPTDYRGLSPVGSKWSLLDVWQRSGSKVRHFRAGRSGGGGLIQCWTGDHLILI